MRIKLKISRREILFISIMSEELLIDRILGYRIIGYKENCNVWASLKTVYVYNNKHIGELITASSGRWQSPISCVGQDNNSPSPGPAHSCEERLEVLAPLLGYCWCWLPCSPWVSRLYWLHPVYHLPYTTCSPPAYRQIWHQIWKIFSQLKYFYFLFVTCYSLKTVIT